MAEIGTILGRKRALQIKKAQIRPDRRSDKKALPENSVLPRREVIPPDHRSRREVASAPNLKATSHLIPQVKIAQIRASWHASEHAW